MSENETSENIRYLNKIFENIDIVDLPIDYRIREKPRESSDETIFDAVEDAGKALFWLRENAEMLKIDPSKIPKQREK